MASPEPNRPADAFAYPPEPQAAIATDVPRFEVSIDDMLIDLDAALQSLDAAQHPAQVGEDSDG